MFKFDRAKILPIFLEKRITVAELARLAGVAHQSAQRAVSGEKVSALIVAKVAAALGIEKTADYLKPPASFKNMDASEIY